MIKFGMTAIFKTIIHLFYFDRSFIFAFTFFKNFFTAGNLVLQIPNPKARNTKPGPGVINRITPIMTKIPPITETIILLIIRKYYQKES